MITLGAEAGGFAACICCICCRGTGTPGLRCSTCCLAAKDGGGGGGAFLAMTGRLSTLCGGAATRFTVLACRPSTAC